jgi:hypothetical protein
LACWTQEEIAEEVGCDKTDKALRVSGNPADLPENQKPSAHHATDFDPPIYNVWKQQKRVAEVLGVAQNTISDWFRPKATSNIGSDNGSKPKPKKPQPDARVKVNPVSKPSASQPQPRAAVVAVHFAGSWRAPERTKAYQATVRGHRGLVSPQPVAQLPPTVVA